MNRIILNKNSKIEGDKAVITESIETTMDRVQLESKQRDLQMRKAGLREQNQRLVDEYEKLTVEESDIRNLILQLEEIGGIKEIKQDVGKGI